MRAWLLVIAACGHIGFDAGTPTQSVLSLDRVAPGEPVADFPLLVVLDDTRADRTVLRPDASDLRFLAADGTPLAFEIEQVGAAGGAPLVAWVRIPSVADDSVTITASYGVPFAPRATGSAWSDAYEAVWHMTGSGALVDSTAHLPDGVAFGTAEVPGEIGPARAFHIQSMDWIRVDDGGSIDPAQLSLSGWIYMNQPQASMVYDSIVTREQDDSSADDFFLGTVSQEAYGDAGEMNSISGDTLAIQSWQHVEFTWDGANQLVYLGTSAQGPVPTPGPLGDSGGPLYIGADRDDNDGTTPPDTADLDFVDGMLDEIRIENVARDAAWIAYDFASQQDAIITYGPVER